jgi:malate dehydrogenase (oxaloacetate-decarboxylating)(NADP+)
MSRLRAFSAWIRHSSTGPARMSGIIRPFRSSACSSTQAEDDHDEPEANMMIPWVRTVISGVAIMRHPKYNKGLAFTEKERGVLHLRGLLPPAVLSLATQMERVLINVRMKASDVERYSYMQSLHERNENLFFQVVREHIGELLPILHLPTVRQACKKYGLMFKSLPRSLFITRQDSGTVQQALKNWPERRIKVVMITNGERVGSAGDLGVHAVNAAIAKLSLVTAVGGVAPSLCLPILVDLGTNNEELLKSQFYSGLRHKRISGDLAQDLMHDILNAIENRFGNKTMVFFEDMSYHTSQRLLSQCRYALTSSPLAICWPSPSTCLPATCPWARLKTRQPW